jgi:hypothetical protein
MLGKTSVSMMVLLVAASLIGISSIQQYLEAQTPTPQLTQQQSAKGNVLQTSIYESSSGRICVAAVKLSSNEPNNLGLKPGTRIDLFAPSENCVLFGLSKIGKTQISFDARKQTPNPENLVYTATRLTF